MFFSRRQYLVSYSREQKPQNPGAALTRPQAISRNYWSRVDHETFPQFNRQQAPSHGLPCQTIAERWQLISGRSNTSSRSRAPVLLAQETRSRSLEFNLPRRRSRARRSPTRRRTSSPRHGRCPLAKRSESVNGVYPRVDLIPSDITLPGNGRK